MTSSEPMTLTFRVDHFCINGFEICENYPDRPSNKAAVNKIRHIFKRLFLHYH